MDAPVAAAIGDLMVVRATPAIGRIDLTAMAIGLTVMGIVGAIKQPVGNEGVLPMLKLYDTEKRSPRRLLRRKPFTRASGPLASK